MTLSGVRIDGEIVRGIAAGLAVGAVVLVAAWPFMRPAAVSTPPPRAVAASRPQAAPSAPPTQPDFGRDSAPDAVRSVARWAVQTADHGGRTFVIVDKRQTRVYVFDADGKLAGATPVLLGYAAGDHSVAGIGQRPIAAVRPAERTTPAGRFVAEPGRNAANEEVLWVDYDAAVSMHRVRATDPKERRLQRLASPSPADNRISYGCINVPVHFFEQVLWPRVRATPTVVYVLPERRALGEVFPALAGPALI